ncbi:MAG TPA: methyltransferase domain-containing protein [Polyangiaceae bacterium]|nr:methyltransferase domain-containing protein [Polyangiaceae bacterium]
MTKPLTVLFACVHNAGRSQMAAAWLNHLADPGKAAAVSAGTEPGQRVHPEVLEAMQEVGINLGGSVPRFLSEELAREAALLVTMGCGETCPVAPGLERQDWPLEDPKGKPMARVREIRDEVRARVQELISSRGWEKAKPRTSQTHGRLWGERARDWADFQEGTVRPVFETVLSRTHVGAGTKYLDVGCGSGMVAEMAAARGANVSGVDAAEAMLAIARSRVPAGEFCQGDLEELPFADETFDVVTGFNSFQYAGNPVAALREAGRVVKKGGWVVVMTFGNPQGMEVVALLTALKPLLPPPPAGAPGPFALSDENVLRNFAADAGLTPVEVFDVDSPWIYADETSALRGLTSTGNAIRAMEQIDEQVVIQAYLKALAQFRQADGSYRASAWFRCLLAQR